jgi:hypothetical protein
VKALSWAPPAFAGTPQPAAEGNGYLLSNIALEEKDMKLVLLATLASFAAVPAFAQTTVYSDSDSGTHVVVTPPPDSIDTRTAAANAARESYYQNKLDAAQAQARADDAIAERDAAEERAADDRDAARDAEDDR